MLKREVQTKSKHDIAGKGDKLHYVQKKVYLRTLVQNGVFCLSSKIAIRIYMPKEMKISIGNENFSLTSNNCPEINSSYSLF